MSQGDQADGSVGAPLSVAMLLHGTYPWDERVKREAEALVDAGHSVDVLCLSQHAAEPRRDACHGVSVHRAKSSRSRSEGKVSYILEYLRSFVGAGTKLGLLNLRRRYDVIQVHTLPDFLVFAALPLKLGGARIVLDIHDLMPELYASKYGLDADGRAVRTLRAIEGASVRVADHVLTASEAFRDRLVASGVPASKITLVLNSADSSVFPAPEHARVPGSSGRFTVFWHGTMVRRYGLDVALRACALVRDRIPELRLSLYGDGEHAPELRALSHDLGLDDVVAFNGFVPHTDLAPLIAEADLGLVANLPDAHINMAYPTKLFEFVQMGVPVVATRTTILERRFGEDGLIFAEATEEDLARAILWAYEHPELARDTVIRARERCADMSWDRVRQEYVASVERTARASSTRQAAQR